MSGYIDLPIEQGKNDLAYKNGKILWVKGEDEIIQRVRTRLRRIFGEWFLYYAAGIPYYNGNMLGSNDYDYTRLTIKNEILSTKGVTECSKINIILEPVTKKVSVYAQIRINSNIYDITEEL